MYKTAVVLLSGVIAWTGNLRAHQYWISIDREQRCAYVRQGWAFSDIKTFVKYDFNAPDVPFREEEMEHDSGGLPGTSICEQTDFGGGGEFEKCSSNYRYIYFIRGEELIRVNDRCSGKGWVLRSAVSDTNADYQVQMGRDFVENRQIIHDEDYLYLGYSGGVMGLRVYELGKNGYLIEKGSYRQDYATTHLVNIVKYGNTIYGSYGLAGVWKFDVSVKPDMEITAGVSCGTMYAGCVAIAFKHAFTTSFKHGQFAEYDICRINDKILHLPFDEMAGSAAGDLSGHGNHGSLQGRPTWITCSDPRGCGLSFDGDDDVVVVRNPRIYGMMMTAALWIEPGSPRDGALIAKAAGPELQDHDWMLAVDNKQRLRGVLKTAGTTSELYSGPQSIPEDEWVHVAMVYRDDRFTLYIDGHEAASTSKSGMIDCNDSVPVYIGNSPSGEESSGFEGAINDVRLYDYDLSSDEIAALAEDSQAVATSRPEGMDRAPGAMTGIRWFDLRGRNVRPDGMLHGRAANGVILRQVTTTSQGISTDKVLGIGGRGGVTGAACHHVDRKPR